MLDFIHTPQHELCSLDHIQNLQWLQRNYQFCGRFESLPHLTHHITAQIRIMNLHGNCLILAMCWRLSGWYLHVSFGSAVASCKPDGTSVAVYSILATACKTYHPVFDDPLRTVTTRFPCQPSPKQRA